MTSPSATEVATAATAVGSAAGTTLVGHAGALQSVLDDLSTLTVSQLVTLFHRNQKRADFPALLKHAVPHIVLPHARAAATVTAQWYDEIAGTRNFTATPIVDIPTDRIDKTVDWALHAPTEKKPVELLFKPATEAEPSDFAVWEEDPGITLSRLAGSTKRMVYDASRDTVVSNTIKQGIRWARVAQPDACAFCRLLSTRGAVYRSQADALQVSGASIGLTLADRRMRENGLATTEELLARRQTYVKGSRKGQAKTRRVRGERELGDKYHDWCRCTAVPIPDGQTFEPPDYAQQWESDYTDAVTAARAAGRTKGKYGAIDIKAVLAQMRANTDAH